MVVVPERTGHVLEHAGLAGGDGAVGEVQEGGEALVVEREDLRVGGKRRSGAGEAGRGRGGGGVMVLG